MLLKRIENEGEIVSLYESSNIFGSKFKGNELTVVFKTGSTYVYEDVSKTEFILFETAESQGKVLNSKIKSKTFSKIDDTNLDKFLSGNGEEFSLLIEEIFEDLERLKNNDT